MRTTHNRPRTCNRDRRRGAAFVELAVCLPLLMTVLLMAMQAADVIYLKQSLHIAGYEAAREAIEPVSTSAEARAAAEQILNDRGVQDYEIEITPANVSTVPRGETITVTVRTTIDNNTVLPAWYLSEVLSAEVYMNKE